MLSAGLPLLLAVWALAGRRDLSTHVPPPPGAGPAPAPRPRPAGAPTPAAPPIVPVSHTTAVQVQPAPWPQVVPAGLPAFPGAQWVPDNPPGAGVVARASALIPILWAHGAGTFRTEQTAGRWITYRATPMGQKKGVVAFKLVGEPTITVHPAEIVPTPAPASPAAAPSPTVQASAPSTALRTLRLTSPRTEGPDVRTLQERLGIAADGVFGSGTHAAVLSYQRSHALNPDGVVGPKTWGSLFGRSA